LRAIIKGNQINSHNCVNYLKDIIDEKNRELAKSYGQIHSQKESFEKRIDELIAQKDIINVELESIIDRKYVELKEKNNRINNLQIIIDKQKQESY
jgi:flagellar biosynthesis chaperone FliJ